jgi:hypothetical protein
MFFRSVSWFIFTLVQLGISPILLSNKPTFFSGVEKGNQFHRLPFFQYDWKEEYDLPVCSSSCFAFSSTLKMNTVFQPETSVVVLQPISRHILQDNTLQLRKHMIQHDWTLRGSWILNSFESKLVRDPRAGLDVVKKRNILPLPRFEPRPSRWIFAEPYWVYRHFI